MNGQVKWQTLSRVSALEQRLKRANRKQNNRTECRFNGKLKDNLSCLSSRLYAAIEIAFCYAVFSVNPFSGRISKRAFVESLSLETIIRSGFLSQGIKLFVENLLTDVQSKQIIVSTQMIFWA